MVKEGPPTNQLDRAIKETLQNIEHSSRQAYKILQEALDENDSNKIKKKIEIALSEISKISQPQTKDKNTTVKPPTVDNTHKPWSNLDQWIIKP